MAALGAPSEAVPPFTVPVDRVALADLRDRLRRTRWPEAATEPGWAQGVPLPVLQQFCAHWADAYDWAATAERLAELPQLITAVGGLDLHAAHLRSDRANAIPVILTHGWPGSFLEFEEVAQLLAAPPPGEPAFHVVLPSLPGYGFSGRPTEPGWGIHRIAKAWATLMERLGYDRFLAAGSDWGTSVSTCLALQHPERLLGLHLVPPLVGPERDRPTVAEAAAQRALAERGRDGSAYSEVHADRPQTLGYGLSDSPAGLAAWLLEKIWAWADHDGELWSVLPRDRVLDDLTLYWLTGTATSSARLYRESIAEVSGWFGGASASTAEPIDVPTGATVFPRELPHPSRREAERRFRRIVHWGEPDRGGHFGAWEQPQIFANELRATARALS